MSIETTAKCMNDDQDRIEFGYFPQEKIMKFLVEDPRSTDSLVKSDKIHLPLIPDSLHGFFSVFKYNIKNVKFDT
jgi:hypothetical protein